MLKQQYTRVSKKVTIKNRSSTGRPLKQGVSLSSPLWSTPQNQGFPGVPSPPPPPPRTVWGTQRRASPEAGMGPSFACAGTKTTESGGIEAWTTKFPVTSKVKQTKTTKTIGLWIKPPKLGSLPKLVFGFYRSQERRQWDFLAKHKTHVLGFGQNKADPVLGLTRYGTGSGFVCRSFFCFFAYSGVGPEKGLLRAVPMLPTMLP